MTSPTIVVVTDPEDWTLDLPEVEVVASRDYLADPGLAARRGVRVVNLCRSYRYQKAGYYVSLLGHARGHRPMPSLATIQDAKSSTVVRLISEDLEDMMEEVLADCPEPEVVLQVYFGQEATGRYPQLVRALFGRLPMPLMRAVFTRRERTERWALTACTPLEMRRVPKTDAAALASAMGAFLRRRSQTRRVDVRRYDLAILVDPRAESPPSNAGALRRFVAAGEAEGFAVELIERDDYARVAEFDALFIRETTAVNHRTFRFAQRAAKEGLVVIDDPESILRCTNKVFLAEVLARAGIPAPKTIVAHRGNLDVVIETIGLPCVLKQPDSSFSQGVVKVDNLDAFRDATKRLLARSDLIVAQAFTPSEFDWRIGVIGGQPFYAAKYYMARRHWQVIHRDEATSTVVDGDTEAVPLSVVPEFVLRAAVRAAALMGNSLYGVDVKESGGSAYVIEVNDNPSIDEGYEDGVLGEELYRRIMREFRSRLEQRRRVPGAQ